MEGGYTWNLHPSAEREMKIISMKVNEIELFCLIENLFHHQSMMRQRIDAFRD